jgi:hypothetical protein
MSIEQMDAFELQQSIIDKKKELDELNSNVEKLSTEKKLSPTSSMNFRKRLIMLKCKNEEC